ncbi:MAG: metalloregulator ArsR/SmtB family transcription factor [Elusimicrobiales bacterium]|nr:metalloregulator ArsR/SmtB family transcription factor [Elusimicrobiales bacterium]
MADADAIKKLKLEFRNSQKMLTAFGDEGRQNLLMLMIMENCKEMRAAELAEKTNLSRPAISHHMQILRDAGIVKCRKDGKYIYYFLNSGGHQLDLLLELFQDMKHQIEKIIT